MLLTDKTLQNILVKNILLLLLTIIVLSACKSTSQAVHLNSVQFVDTYLQDYIQIDHKTLSVSETGNNRLNVMMRNLSNQTMLLEVNTAWYNADFISTEEAKSWQRIELKPKQSHLLQTYATNNNSSHFVVNVRNGGQ